MNSLGWFIFLANLSGEIKFFCIIISCFLLVGIAILSIMLFMTLDSYYMHNKDDKLKIKTFKKYIKLCIISCICFGLLSLAFPSTKTLAAMYVLPKIANNQDIQHVVNDNLESLRLLSEKWLIELMQENDKKEGK